MKNNRTVWLMLAPALIIVIGLFIGGFTFGLLQSFNYMPLINQNIFNFNAYITILGNQEFITSLLYTFFISITATVVSILLAVAASMGIRKAFKHKSSVLFAYQFILPIPHLVSAIAILMLFGQSGFLSRILYWLGIVTNPADFPQIIYGKSGVGIILALLWKFVPFVGVAILAILQSTGADYEEAAISLGANAWQRFIHVLFPIMLPSITTSAILIFAYAFSSFEIPFLLGSVYPKTLAIVAYQKFMDIDITVRPQAMAMSTIITVIVIFVVLLYKKLAAKFRY